MSTYELLCGDAAEMIATLDAESVQTCITSPPYFGLRDYGVAGQIGLEDTPDAFVARLVAVFRGVRRVLRDDGTLWINIGDSYAGGPVGSLGRNDAGRNLTGGGGNRAGSGNPGKQGVHHLSTGCKPKDLLGIPWLLAFALRAEGWYLRADVIWSKPNPMPESVTDRPTKAHEYVFLLSKSDRYYYDAAAIAEPATHAGKIVTLGEKSLSRGQATGAGIAASGNGTADSVTVADTRNKRSVWEVATQPYPGAHFATYPPKLIEPCILAGSKRGDLVLDPFNGSGTTGTVALKHGRRYVGIDLNPEYIKLAHERIGPVAAQRSLFDEVAS